MTTTVQNVFADTEVTATAANGPALQTSNSSPTDTSTASQSFSSNWPGYDPDGPTNTYNTSKYVYQVSFDYTAVTFTLTKGTIDSYDVDGPRTSTTSNLSTTFYYRGSGTQAGATNNLPSSVSTTQTFTGGTTASNGLFQRNYDVDRTYNVNASWHWEGNLFSIDGVGGDSLPTFACQSTVTATGGLIHGGDTAVTSDAQQTVSAVTTLGGQSTVQSQFTANITPGVIRGFDLSSVDAEYVAQGDSAQGEYVAQGDSAQGEYVILALPDLTNSQASDGQLTCVGGFVQSGDTSITADAQTSITGTQIFASDANLSSDFQSTATGGNLIEVGGANYHNNYVVDDYITPETLNIFNSDVTVTASTIRLLGGEGIVASAAQITAVGGYLLASGTVTLAGDATFTIDQTAGTSAGIIHGGFTVEPLAQFTQTTTANNIIDIDDELTVQSFILRAVMGDVDSGVLNATIDSQVTIEGRIIPKTNALVFADSQLTAVGGFQIDLASSIVSNGFALTVAQYKIVDPFRTIKAKSETRSIIVTNEDRLVLIDTESRVNKVEQEIRNSTVPQETREIKSQYLTLDRGTPVGSNERRIG